MAACLYMVMMFVSYVFLFSVSISIIIIVVMKINSIISIVRRVHMWEV